MNDWITPAEREEYRSTPDHAETMAYLQRLAGAFPDRVRIEPFGTTGEGRPLHLVIVSGDGVFEPERVHRSGRAVLLVQNAIHAGEMDGKDACLALLRDLLVDPARSTLLQKVVLLFIPIYNVDGHERRSPYNRINQNGPDQMGWRANGTNLNLNRDYLKADAPETRAFLRMFHRWLPDFFVDNHVTDGADFQYEVTFSLDCTPDVPASTAAWIQETVTPTIARELETTGHPTFPRLVFLKDDTDPSQGIAFRDNPPRFSTGQMLLENRPGLLVELHMLKDYRTRVRANYELLVSLLGVLNRESSRILELNRAADEEAASLAGSPGGRRRFPLTLAASGRTTPVMFRGLSFTRSMSEVSGAPWVRYGKEPWNASLPEELEARVAVSVELPVGYLIPPAWSAVIGVLDAHGVLLRRTRERWTGPVECYHLEGMAWPRRPFEGRFPILGGGNVEQSMGTFGRCRLEVRERTFPAGSTVVPLQQRLSKVAVHWLEPEAPDSAFRWGFFHSLLEQKESGEAYVLERIAREALASDPQLKSEFERKLGTDPAFAASPADRLQFFYDRSEWGRANQVGEYPVGRLLSLDGLPLE
jgi:murein tripeptide amidase MpaA